MIKREVIGVPECPLMYRWTLLGEPTWRGKWSFKVMLHYFLPTQRDRDPHDHPRSFVTFVLRGGYEDISQCARCNGEGTVLPDDAPCSTCQGTGVLVDRVHAPAFRFRPAEHAHITVAGRKGAWTLVVMGPRRRAWGFLRDGRWWPWKRYEEKFGLDFRCESDE